ncbi:MAG TPA: toxin HicA [Anaerolineae bacterium]|nr:toxin HicA [Anaerolineae bacterium]
MSKAEKLLQKIKNNPKTVPFHDLDRVLIGYGFTRRMPRSGSSHTIYTLGQHQISVPYKRPYVKEVYVRHVLEILDQIDEEKGGQR